MPNDCWNEMTITGASGELVQFVAHELAGIPDWALTFQRRGIEGIQFRLWSNDGMPEYGWLEGLLVQYPSFWSKNVWCEEGGKAGVWIGSRAGGVRRFEWDDMCLEEKAHRFRASVS